jgi:hypothetical protein
MTENKKAVERYIDGFKKSDHAQILSCLTDDVEWIMPGAFHHVGKAAFDGEIENDLPRGSEMRLRFTTRSGSAASGLELVRAVATPRVTHLKFARR